MEDFTGMLAVAGGLLIVLIPVAGLTARFALKPLIESISNASVPSTAWLLAH